MFADFVHTITQCSLRQQLSRKVWHSDFDLQMTLTFVAWMYEKHLHWPYLFSFVGQFSLYMQQWSLPQQHSMEVWYHDLDLQMTLAFVTWKYKNIRIDHTFFYLLANFVPRCTQCALRKPLLIEYHLKIILTTQISEMFEKSSFNEVSSFTPCIIYSYVCTQFYATHSLFSEAGLYCFAYVCALVGP